MGFPEKPPAWEMCTSSSRESSGERTGSVYGLTTPLALDGKTSWMGWAPPAGVGLPTSSYAATTAGRAAAGRCRLLAARVAAQDRQTQPRLSAQLRPMVGGVTASSTPAALWVSTMEGAPGQCRLLPSKRGGARTPGSASSRAHTCSRAAASSDACVQRQAHEQEPAITTHNTTSYPNWCRQRARYGRRHGAGGREQQVPWPTTTQHCRRRCLQCMPVVAAQAAGAMATEITGWS